MHLFKYGVRYELFEIILDTLCEFAIICGIHWIVEKLNYQKLKPSGSLQAVVRQSSGSHRAVVRQSSGSRLAVVWQSSDSSLAVIRQ